VDCQNSKFLKQIGGRAGNKFCRIDFDNYKNKTDTFLSVSVLNFATNSLALAASSTRMFSVIIRAVYSVM